MKKHNSKTWCTRYKGVYSEPSETSKMENIAKIVNRFKPLTYFALASSLNVQIGSEYVSDVILQNAKF